MRDQWEKDLACATACYRCDARLAAADKRILSVFDHQPVCMACKLAEEKRSDYADVSKHMIGACMIDTEVGYGDTGGYCYYHFYPFTCDH
jgi:hypothetical protein